MTKFILLATGGAIGTLCRYGLSGLAHRIFDGSFPYGTLAVNLTGSFFIGIVWGFYEEWNIQTHIRTFIFMGIFGGFTTFSTYTLETLNLFRDGETKIALMNILANNILGLLLVVLGFFCVRGLFNFIR